MGITISRKESTFLIGLSFIMLLGFGAYFKLWTIDYDIFLKDKDSIRRQFHLANIKAHTAMEESATWRLHYEDEAQRANDCMKELREVKTAFERKAEEIVEISNQLTIQKHENLVVLGRVKELDLLLDGAHLPYSEVKQQYEYEKGDNVQGFYL